MGVSQILFGNIEEDGSMSKNLEAVGYTLQDSTSITPDDPEVQEFYAEEVDTPVITKSKKGKVNFATQIMNPSLQVLHKFLGGTLEEHRWGDGSTYEHIEKSIRIIPDQGAACIDLPRVKIDAKLNMPLNNSSLATLDVAGILLQPEKEGEKKLWIYDKMPASESSGL